MQLPPLTSINSNSNIRTLLRETLGEDKSPIKHVLSAAGEQQIVSLEFNPEIHPNITCCPITIKEFTKGDTISQLPCKHLFNPEAILKWLKEEKAECPICRFKLESTEKKMGRSDSSNNTVDSTSRLQNRMSSNNIRLMPGFRPPRMPRRRHRDHLRRLMFSRQEREEEEELQAAFTSKFRRSIYA